MKLDLLILPIDQIPMFWDSIRDCTMRALPPGMRATDVLTRNLLARLSSGEMQAWAIVDSQTEVVPVGYMVTEIQKDLLSEEDNCLIYSLATNQDAEAVPDAEWGRLLETLKKWARVEGAKKISAYTSNPRFIHLVERMGIESSSRFVVVEA